MPHRIRRAFAAPLAAIICAVSAAPAAEAQRRSANEHGQIVQEFGGEIAGPLGGLVDTVGMRIAAQTGRRVSGDVTLLNSPVANAFATSTGRVYITRQLMALMNSEDELAFVIGHEAGHIAARHSQRRQTTSLVSRIGAALLGVVTGSSQLAQIAGAVGQQYLLSFSRDQEYESDRLGVRYLAGSGYNPLSSTEILDTLNTYSNLQSRFAGREDDQRSTPAWNSTHPLSRDRIARARREAQATGRAGTPEARSRYLSAIDGMVFDDDPRQGVVEGRTFLHPDLRFAFDAPQGYGISNSARAVGVRGRQGQALFSTGPYNGQLESFALQALQAVVGNQARVQATRPERFTINGLPAAGTSARVATRSGSADLTVVAYEFGPRQAYYIATMTPGGSGAGPFAGMIQSVRRLTTQEAANIRPRVVDIVTAGRGDTVASLARRMAYPTLQVERFRTLNGLTGGEGVSPGQRVKLVVYGTPR